VVRAGDRVPALGGVWEEPEVRLWTCTDDDNYKGWQRSVRVRPLHGGSGVASTLTLTPDLEDTIRALLEDHDYDDVSRNGIADVDSRGLRR